MLVDVCVAFGGVALLGVIGFWTAWFTEAPGKTRVDISTVTEKQKITAVIVAEFAEVEKTLQAVSKQIAHL